MISGEHSVRPMWLQPAELWGLSYVLALRQLSQVIVAVSVFAELVNPSTNVPSGGQINSF